MGIWDVKNISRYGLIGIVILFCVCLSFLSPNFLTWQNFTIVARQVSINGILAIGVTYVLLTGGVDLSLGSVVALSGVISAIVARSAEISAFVAVAVGVCVGFLCGFSNGFVVAKGKVAPFIVTLGMMTIARGLALVVSGGKPVSGLKDSFIALSGESFLGVPNPVLIMGVAAVLSHIFLRYTKYGRYIYAIGSNEATAYVCGVNVPSVKLFAYAICGAFAGLAGVMLAARITTGQPNAGIAYELDAIAAAVIGGTSLSGGVGSIVGTVIGAFLMGIINNGLDLLNVSSYYQQIIKGVIIIVAVWSDSVPRRREVDRIV
ncbi:MAG: ABC transporter permease [Verrucomicrobiae bacterium]|nr:ABC transporter permease [Verrucomicrobiae bacterium]